MGKKEMKAKLIQPNRQKARRTMGTYQEREGQESYTGSQDSVTIAAYLSGEKRGVRNLSGALDKYN